MSKRGQFLGELSSRVCGAATVFALILFVGVLLLASPGARAQDVEQIFVSSFGNNSVRDYNAKNGSFIEVFVQGPTSGLDGPWALVFGPDGNLYVSSFATDEVLRYDGDTGAFIDAFVTAGSGGLDQPFTLLFGPDGDLYVSSQGTRNILQYDGTTGDFVGVFVAEGSGGLGVPYAFVFGPDENLYATSFGTDQVLRYDGDTGAFIDVFVTAGSGGLSAPSGLVFGSDDNLYVNSRGASQVLRYNGTTGAFIDVFVASGSGGLNDPQFLLFGPEGGLYVSSKGTDEVLRYNGASGVFIDAFVSSGSGGLNDPFDFVFGPDENLYVTSFATDQVLQYNGASGAFLSAFISEDTDGLDQPEGLVFGPESNLYVISRGSNEVLRYDGITGVLIDTFVASGAGGLDAPRFLVFGPDGNLYVTSSGNDSVLRYNGTTGAFIDTFVASGSGGLDQPFGLAFGPDGNLYVASRGTNQVLEYNGVTGAFVGAFVSAGSGGLNLPWALVFGPDGNLYVTSRGTGEVLRYQGATGVFLGTFVTAGSGGLLGAFCLAFGLDNNLYVCSFGTDSVLRYNGVTGAFIDSFVTSGSGGLDGPAALVFRKFISLSQTALLGTNDVKLKKDSKVISGNVIDNPVDGKIDLGRGAMTPAGFDVIADEVKIKKDAEVAGQVTYNELKNNGNITGGSARGATLPVFDDLPPFQSAPPGSARVVVGKNESRTLDPGDYGKIIVRKDGQLTFSGGTYNVESIEAKKNASLLFAGASEVRVSKNMKAGNDTHVGPSNGSGIGAADIVFYVAGRKVNLGKNSNVHANFYAPDGKINFKGNEAVGGFIGEKLRIGNGSSVSLDSFVPNACDLTYYLPSDVGVNLPAAFDVQPAFDEYSWRTFLAINAPGVGQQVNRTGDNATQWEQQWSSTVDLIQCNRLSEFDPIICKCPDNDCTNSGSRYYPEACREVPDFQDYRVLGQLAKVDDSFLEASRGGLSNDPLLDSEGNFLRYEIMVSPFTYQWVVENELYRASVVNGLTEALVFPCGEASYKGGDPANPQMGSMVIKNAWMELNGRDASSYHTEELLVASPAFRNSTGEATCELKTMALVGQHIDHKTVKQPNWIWSTFEHKLNAPDCTALPSSGNEAGSSGPSEACPGAVPFDYNFYAQTCSDDNEACQTCNVVPVSNSPNPDECVNTVLNHPDDTAWCLDLPPAQEEGISTVCRQVPVKENYPSAHALNSHCALSLGFGSVWSNYQLISTQWYNAASSECQNGSSFNQRTLIQPQVDVSASADGGVDTRPFLGNTSMETYVRSNCTGCHSAAETDNKVSTDGMWWIKLEAGDSFTP